MKKWFSKKSNILFTLLFLIAFVQQFSSIKNNLAQESKVIRPRELKVLNNTQKVSILFPPTDSRAIAIFWASWCGPCKIEMARLKNSVESKAIPKELVFAINPFESDAEAKKFINENNYPFTFLTQSTLPAELGVKVTPTTIFMDKGTITSMSSGMSIWGIWRAEIFL